MFADVPGYDYMMRLLPWAMVGTVVGVLLIIVAKIMGKSVERRSREPFTGMTVQDIDKMRRDGVISEEEYKKIRHKAAERELESMRQQNEAEQDRLILAEVELNPDAARKLLKPEQFAQQIPAPIKPPAAQQPDISAFDWGDPLATAEPPDAVARASARDDQPVSPEAKSTVTHPQPGKIRIPPPHLEPKKEEPAGELELLLQKGAITREDYDRFKALMRK
ncbi:hypothetical protein LLG95_05165 [bacterium]|nr:hypothetical protein [bacterium]